MGRNGQRKAWVSGLNCGGMHFHVWSVHMCTTVTVKYFMCVRAKAERLTHTTYTMINVLTVSFKSHK